VRSPSAISRVSSFSRLTVIAISGARCPPGRFEIPGVALTDQGSLAGAVEIYRNAHEQGINSIIGCEV
jgi:hypothetical protein